MLNKSNSRKFLLSRTFEIETTKRGEHSDWPSRTRRSAASISPAAGLEKKSRTATSNPLPKSWPLPLPAQGRCPAQGWWPSTVMQSQRESNTLQTALSSGSLERGAAHSSLSVKRQRSSWKGSKPCRARKPGSALSWPDRRP